MNANVYNPWSVVRYIKDLKADENELPCSYCANTSSNSIVRRLIDIANEDTKREIEVVHKYGIAFFGKDCHVLFEE